MIKIDSYKGYIENLAKNQVPEVFLNSNKEHALIVLTALISNANKYVKTVCGDMCSDVSSDQIYLDAVESFLSGDRSRTFEILFDSYNAETFPNTRIAELLKKYKEQVTIKELNREYDHIYYEGKPVHFSVSDDRAFRIETDIHEKMAWGNFNDKEKAEGFKGAFDGFFNDADTSIAVALW